ncbi:MAG: hypothetical protein JO337_00555, partial [Acidimicrobiales bacterium]|nr:hypothetical protein [Acidimicrobiales bacterium]
AIRLAEMAGTHEHPVFTVDLNECSIHAPDASDRPFSIGSYQRQLLLDGRDEITVTLERLDRIETHESAYFDRRPWLAPRR